MMRLPLRFAARIFTELYSFTPKTPVMKRTFYVMTCTLLFAVACNNETRNDSSTAATNAATPAADAKPGPAEFADPKYADVGKKQLAALSSGDIDGWLALFADDAVYVWNNGDSLAGKTAISAYWKKRRTEVIDSISFAEDIWLPVKVNQPQQSEAPGVWLLSWYRTSAKYKGGKSMNQWIHTAMHFNTNDKVDRLIQYLDRAAINAAIK
jgi:hypothetical protein